MRVDQLATDVGVSVEELMEILQDIEIAVEGVESTLSDEQVASVCDELGYASLAEAQADNSAVAPVEEVVEPV